MRKIGFKDVLPEYPSMLHLPWKPNAKGDRVAGWDVGHLVLGTHNVTVQEKLDGANCGMAFFDGHPVVRSRSKILRKGQELKRPSTKQFASAWNWMHENTEKFRRLDEMLGPVSVYGEWLVQQHGMEYDRLPDWFVAYEVYNYDQSFSLDPLSASFYLTEAGFETIPFESPIPIAGWDMLEEMASRPSAFGTGLREGVVVKVSDGRRITDRFKMVRQGFEQGCLLGDEIKKNALTRAG